MYAWYQQIHAPTGIEHCVYCNFTSDKEKDLIVTAASQLTVYRLLRNIEVPGKTENNEDTLLIKDKLEQKGTWQLFGNIVSINSVQLPGSSRDSILLSFKEAKLSLVEFDVLTQEIKTSSLHFFEENLHKDGLLQRVTLPKLSADPDGRCAALQLSTNSVAIVPFRTKDVSLATDEAVSSAEATYQGKRANTATSYSIDLRDVDSRLQRIIDMQFLQGYYEPTLLILFESLRTWAGRVAMRQDTCNIFAISLNMTERLHPVIWSLHGLPFDCKYAYAVPKPIGGVLIFAVNSLLYLNQSVPPYGTSVNCLTENSTSFPLKPQEDVCLTFDCSKATFISPESLVVSLKGGELYVITLLVDSMRSVRNFHFDKAASSVLTSCITTMDDGFVFLGSRLGNSLLLHYTEARSDTSAAPIDSEEPAAKRKRLNTAAEWAAADGNDADDFDMYGHDTVTSEPLSSYVFEVCDSLLNIGPCGAAELGEPAFLSEEFVSQRESDLELAILSGHGKNGALSILQRTVKPQIVTTFELPGCVDMWTVRTKTKEPPTKDFVKQHGYLILSREDSTLILETGKEIMEVEESGYNTRQPTVFVGNIGGEKKFILQVCATGVWLMDGVKLLQEIPIDLGSPIVQCSLLDPYAMLLTADGQFVMLKLTEAETELGFKLHCSNPNVSQVPQVRCICLYGDASELFVTNEQSTSKAAQSTDDMISDEDYKFGEKIGSLSKKNSNDKLSTPAQSTFTADEEDELLYGESDPDAIFTPNFNSLKPQLLESDGQAEENKSNTKEKTLWASLARENGSLEIYKIPNFNLVYVVKNFSNGHKLLVDSSAAHSFSGDTEKGSDLRHSDSPHVFEILLIGLGYKGSRPHLLARVDEELLIYEAFPYKVQDKNFRSSSLQIRFKKVYHNVLIRRLRGSYDRASERQYMDRQTRLRPFENVGGYSGIFLCGPYPHWIFASSRGALYCHPMTVDGPVSCFVSFHNVNCPHGFLYFNLQGELRICMLPPHMKYDNLWPVRKVSLRCTPHFISYSIEHKVYALVSSVSEPCTRLPFLNCDNEREFEDLDRGDRFVYPHIDKFSVQLVSPIGWELIPNARIDMDEYEHVTCMKNVWLSSGADSSVRRNYVVLGTCNIMGEEMSSRGKIIILEVIEVVPEPGQPLTRNKLKQLYSEEQKGPVTAVCGLEGNLLAAIGQKIFIWRFDENQSLRGVAFVDTNVYVHHAFSFRSFAVVADIQKSLTLLRYQEDFKTLSVTSRDVSPMDVYTADLLVDGTSLGFVGSDHEKNLVFFVYDPNDRESHGGTRLIRCADIHIGAHVNCMWRIGTCLVDRASNTANEPYAAAHVTTMGSLDGSLCNILPIAEKVYRRLLMLQNIMVTNLQHTAGLNPKAFRLYRSQQRLLSNSAKNVLDGDLLRKFQDLSHVERQELAKKIGTTSDQILDDFMDIQRATVVM